MNGERSRDKIESWDGNKFLVRHSFDSICQSVRCHSDRVSNSPISSNFWGLSFSKKDYQSPIANLWQWVNKQPNLRHDRDKNGYLYKVPKRERRGEGSRLKCKDAWHKLYVAYLPTSVFWLSRSIELVCCRHNQCSCRSTFFRNFLRDVWNRPHNNICWSWKSSKHG